MNACPNDPPRGGQCSLEYIYRRDTVCSQLEHFIGLGELIDARQRNLRNRALASREWSRAGYSIVSIDESLAAKFEVNSSETKNGTALGSRGRDSTFVKSVPRLRSNCCIRQMQRVFLTELTPRFDFFRTTVLTVCNRWCPESLLFFLLPNHFDLSDVYLDINRDASTIDTPSNAPCPCKRGSERSPRF